MIGIIYLEVKWLKKYNVDWNYWVVRFLFVMALIVGYLLITNYQHFVHSVSGLLGILSPFITGFVIAYLLSGSQKKIEVLLVSLKICRQNVF